MTMDIARGDAARRRARDRLMRSPVLALLVCAPGRRGAGAAVTALLIGGVVGATAPTAVGAAAHGAGVVLGACAALAGAVWVGVLALPALVAVVADPAAADQRALHLAGWSRTARTGRPLAAAGLLALGALCAAAVIGALVGGADAIRHGQPPWSPGPGLTTSAAQALTHAPIWLALSTVALSATLVCANVSARATVPTVVVTTVTFTTLLAVLYPSPLRVLLACSPLGPAWSLTFRSGSERLLLPMSIGQRLTLIIVWACLAALLVATVRRRSAPGHRQMGSPIRKTRPSDRRARPRRRRA
jgi:hypothetical protein